MILKKAIHNYFKKREEVIAVYLFGSHASKKERPFSDVDVGIVLHHKYLNQAFELQSEYMAGLGRKLRKDIHTVVLNSAGELLLKQVFEKGICICVNDTTAFSKFRMKKFSMIADYGYYLNMAQEGFKRVLLWESSRG